MSNEFKNENPETIAPETTPAEQSAPETTETVIGTVVRCDCLNVRNKPTKSGDIVAVIPVGKKVTIDLEKSNDLWYGVQLKTGVEGFCMKEYIETV